MLTHLTAPEKQVFVGNVLFVLCCAFYLAWWLVAFKPTGAVTGPKSGWLLLPATVCGLLGVIEAIRGISAAPVGSRWLPGAAIIVGGLVVYLILLAVTSGIFKRPATTELILIVGWGMLALAEINALVGSGRLSAGLAVGLTLVTGLAVVVSVICYALYYRLDRRAAYVAGLIPLVLAALLMAAVSASLVLRRP